MAFITLGEAVDRVLARLADQRKEESGGKVVSLAAKVAREERAGVKGDRLSRRTPVRRGGTGVPTPPRLE